MRRYFVLWMLGIFLILVGCANKEAPQTALSSSSTHRESEPARPTMPSPTKKLKEGPPMSTDSSHLLQAVIAKDKHQVQLILNQSTTSINEQNEKGESPLLVAVHHNMIEIAKLLIDHGADINLQDEIKDSPYLYAAAQGKTEILDYMLEKSEPDQTIVNRFGGNALIPAAEKGHLANVKLLLADGRVQIDHQNNFGYTALIEAVALRDGSKVYQEIVHELLAYGANKDLRDNEGKTAEDYAKELGYSQILKQLRTTQ
ncbi:ankyrin repeat domain-containing protein [Enterococcus villorum]|nr:ankyrin repeat domain-containing protein [Enterococcus villorum]